MLLFGAERNSLGSFRCGPPMVVLRFCACVLRRKSLAASEGLRSDLHTVLDHCTAMHMLRASLRCYLCEMI